MTWAKPFSVHAWLCGLPLPIWAYRLGRGWALGDRGLVLTHVGRSRRQLRQTLLEVVAHDPAADIYIAAASWGKGWGWLRTIQRQPHVLVDVADRRFEAIAERVSPTKAEHALRDYACRNPLAFRKLAGATTDRHRLGLYDDYRTLAHMLRLIALCPLQR